MITILGIAAGWLAYMGGRDYTGAKSYGLLGMSFALITIGAAIEFYGWARR